MLSHSSFNLFHISIMASRTCYTIINLSLFCILFQKNIMFINGDNCVNPSFGKTEKISVEYFFDAESPGIYKDFCVIVSNSNGLISFTNHMCDGLKDKANCMKNKICVQNRIYACLYKGYQDLYNDCTKSLPGLIPEIADCVCEGAADDILTANEALRIKYGIQSFPALVLNQKYDPCFKDYSLDSMKAYFCKAYKNELPVCHG